MDSLLKALGFMTVLPVGERARDVKLEDVPDMLWFFPVVGVVTGVAGALSAEAASWFLGVRAATAENVAAAPAALAAVASMAIITGGLHLDGLADTFDGLLAYGDARRRLAIMKDSSTGAFGAAALIFAIGAKCSLVWYLLSNGGYVGIPDWWETFSVLVAAGASARWMMLVAAAVGPYARKRKGLGRWFIDSCDGRQVAAGGVFALAMLATVLYGNAFSMLWAVPIGALLFAFGFGWGMLCRRRIGGQTGDTLGAAVELGEIIALFVIVATIF